jgi:hypothetical protein
LNMETLPIIDKFDVQAVPFLGADGILRIPVVFVSGGMEYYEVELKKSGKGKRWFHLVNVPPAK